MLIVDDNDQMRPLASTTLELHLQIAMDSFEAIPEGENTMTSVSHKSSVPASRAAHFISKAGLDMLRLRPIAAVVIGIAAITAAARPAAAAEQIYTGQVCSDKVWYDRSHLCGIAPAAGVLTFTNIGVHLVAVFTLPDWVDTSAWDGSIHGRLGAAGLVAPISSLNIVENVPVNGSAFISINPGDRVYVGRSDGTLSNRTITVRFDEVPGLLGAPPPGVALPEQRIEAVLDGLICPQEGQSGSLDALGITMAVSGTTRFDGESCAELAGLLASGMSFVVDVSILEDGAGLTATAVELVPDKGRGRGRGRGAPRHRN
jgi:hypothetical protein